MVVKTRIAPTMKTAREEILDKILGATAHSVPSRYVDVARSYSAAGKLDREARVELFADRLHDYGAVLYRCAPENVRGTIEQAVVSRGKRSLVIPHGLSREWLPDSAVFRVDDGLTYSELDRCEGVLTGSALAIATTGTIVLRHSREEGRRALTLIPDYHLCVVEASQIVETVVEGVRVMSAWTGALLTTVSGPSATSDIEMTRIKGVHGPRTLDVIVIQA